MLQPQTDDEIRPVVEQLQLLDARLDVQWNPQAVLRKAGAYTALGKNVPAEYDGRWEVILRDRATALTDREYVVLCVVTKAERYGRRQVLIMEKDGPYAPVGEWLVEYMRTWDAAQKRQLEENQKVLDREDELANSAAEHIADRAAHQEAAERVYRKVAGEHWIGRGFGKGKKTTVAST